MLFKNPVMSPPAFIGGHGYMAAVNSNKCITAFFFLLPYCCRRRVAIAAASSEGFAGFCKTRWSSQWRRRKRWRRNEMDWKAGIGSRHVIAVFCISCRIVDFHLHRICLAGDFVALQISQRAEFPDLESRKLTFQSFRFCFGSTFCQRKSVK